MKRGILVLGYFGYKTNQLDGQTVKTRSVYGLIAGHAHETSCVDTEDFQYDRTALLRAIPPILRCRTLVYIPGERSLDVLLPALVALCWLTSTEIVLVAVGGWLARYLRSHRLSRLLLSRVRCILPQSDELTEILRREHHLQNVVTLPNFRIHSFVPPERLHTNGTDPFRVAFFARIHKLKGIETVFQLADHVVGMGSLDRPIIIDFYGPIFKDVKDWFLKEVGRFAFVTYKGVLQPEKVYSTLSAYDVSVLPTRYFTEGFPGSILDSYIAGVPVVVSRWAYADEFVDDGRTGFIVPFNDGHVDFINAVMRLYRDDELLMAMRKNAHEKSKEYSVDRAWEILGPCLEGTPRTGRPKTPAV